MNTKFGEINNEHWSKAEIRLWRNHLFPTELLGLCRQMRDKINMQNKPNLKLTAPWPISPNAPRATSHDSRNMQNKPNYNRKSTTENRKSLQLFIRQMRSFPKKLQKMRSFCKFLKLTHLTPCKTKTYKAFSPCPTGHGARVTIYAKQTQSLIYSFTHILIYTFMQNKPNLNQQATRYERRKNAKRTQFTKRQNCIRINQWPT
jgi:hypothetical protein